MTDSKNLPELESTLFRMLMFGADDILPEQLNSELKECIEKMHQVSRSFYCGAVHVNNHPFVEFTGLINEYIKVCERAAAKQEDFRMASVHTEAGPLKLHDHEIAYIQEKLKCIYGEQIFERRIRQ